MVLATVLCAAIVAWAVDAGPQEPVRSDGWVVIGVDEYRALRLKAFPPDQPPDPPPVEATLTRLDYDLRVDGDSIAGQARLTVDVLREGWVRVQIPAGMLVRGVRLDGRAVPLIGAPAPHVLLSKPGRAVLLLDVVVPLRMTGDAEALTLPPSPVSVSRVALVISRPGIDVAVSGGVLAERPQDPDGRWVAYARTGQPLTLTWRRRVDDVRATQALRWRGSVTELVGLGEEGSSLIATVRVDVVQGRASSIDVAVPEGVVVNQVSGPLVADWVFRPGALEVSFLEPVSAQTSLTITGEAKVPRDGIVSVPLVRLPAAERETGGVAVEVVGAGEIGERQVQGLDPADPSDLGEPLSGRESPSMVAFRFKPQEGSASRSLAVNVARYTPQAVLIANIEEARYEALVGEEGKAMVRARYAVRNNQRAFLAMTLPGDATLWSAAVAGRPVRPGISPSGSLLLPLDKGRAGEDTPVFAVEVTYVQRVGGWHEKGRGVLSLPAVDLPTSRTGLVLHHSPRFRVTPEPGTFRVEADSGPFSEVLRSDSAALAKAAPAAPPSPRAPADELIARFQKDHAGRGYAGPLPLRVPFPQFGPSIFLMWELTAESQPPSIEYSYKRESRW